jgi:hypothetical protein
MKTAREILAHCRAAGLTFRSVGERIEVRPSRLTTPELLAAIRTHKSALLLLLEAEAAQLPSDCAPWLHTARQIVAGEFDGGCRATLESLLIGVRNIVHPACQDARKRLETRLGRKQREARR